MPVPPGHEHHKPDGVYSSLVSGPVNPLLSLAEAKEYLRIDHSDEDTLLTAAVQAATDFVDAQWGQLGRALVTQRWQLSLVDWVDHIHLPVTPVQQVISFHYYDEANAEQVFSTDNYSLFTNGEEATIYLADGVTLPALYDRPDAIHIQYDAGYGDAASDVPEGIRQAVRIALAHFYARGGDSIPAGFDALLMPYRISRGFI